MNENLKNIVESLKDVLKTTLPFCYHNDPKVADMAKAVNKKTYETLAEVAKIERSILSAR